MSMAASTLVDLGKTTAQINGELFTRLSGRCVPYGVYEKTGLFYERVQRGAFTESLVRQPAVPLLLWHDHQSFPIGSAVDWDDREDGLYGRFKIALTPAAQEAARLARDEMLTGMSVGFVTQLSTWDYVADWNPNEGKLDRATRTKGRLCEVSLTPCPAFDGARVELVEAEPLVPTARSHLRQWTAWRRAYAAMHGR